MYSKQVGRIVMGQKSTEYRVGTVVFNPTTTSEIVHPSIDPYATSGVELEEWVNGEWNSNGLVRGVSC